MAIMAMDTQVKKLASIFLSSIFAFSATAGDLKLTPGIELEETYSDNAELTENGDISSLVTQTSVNLAVDYKTQDADLKFNSKSTYAFYSHDHELDTDYHFLNASARYGLGASGFTLTGDASVQNTARNNARNGLASIISGDLIQVETYKAGLQYQAGNSHYYLTSALNYQTTRSEDNIGESDSANFSFNSTNGAAAKNLFWDARGNFNNREYEARDSKQQIIELKFGLITQYKFNPFIRYYDEDNTGNISQRQGSFNTNAYGAGFRWQPIPRLYIDLSYNEPIDDSPDFNGEEQKAFVDASINWQPTSRTQIRASHSQRFFGDSYGLNIKHQNKRLTNQISYDEQVQSFTRDNYRLTSSTILCQDPNTTNADDCFLSSGDILNPEDLTPITINDLELIEDNDYWLNKTLTWSSSLKLARTSFDMSLSSSERENLNTLNINETKSASFSANRKLGPNTSLDFSMNYLERIYNQNSDQNQTDHYRKYQLGYQKTLSSTLKTNLSLGHYNRSSNNARFNYDENRITATITKDF